MKDPDVPLNVGPTDIWRLHQMGYLTANGIARLFGLPTLTAAFIVATLKIPPDHLLQNRQGFYWSPASQERIRLALIAMLGALKIGGA